MNGSSHRLFAAKPCGCPCDVDEDGLRLMQRATCPKGFAELFQTDDGAELLELFSQGYNLFQIGLRIVFGPGGFRAHSAHLRQRHGRYDPARTGGRVGRSHDSPATRIVDEQHPRPEGLIRPGIHAQLGRLSLPRGDGEALAGPIGQPNAKHPLLHADSLPSHSP